MHALAELSLCATLWALMFVPAVGQPAAVEAAAPPHSAADEADEMASRVRETYRPAVRSPDWAELPIGVFDSGTGGLAVLDEILKLDAFDNSNAGLVGRADATPDFCRERFVFLADQANMPYGNYANAEKTGFLLERIRHDGLFLLGREYFSSAESLQPRSDKRLIKALVIACNTATAYGKADLESMIAKAGLDIQVIGVVDAGARGALQVLQHAGNGTVGVLATEGTVSTGAYPAALRHLAAQYGLHDSIDVVQQGSLGLAGAIDGAREFIVQLCASDQPRGDYRGPSFDNRRAPIDPRLLPRYGFDFSAHRMLLAGQRNNPETLQINSIGNYVHYDVVSLLESLRRTPNARPLRAVILGCTHFPYYAPAIRAELRRLFDYQEEGRYVYREHMAADVALVDPAVIVAEELYTNLSRRQRLAAGGATARGDTRGEFYITVPDKRYPGVRLDERGWFTYEYKYSREAGRAESDVRTVPMTLAHLDPAAIARLRQNVPQAWALLQDFLANNGKVPTAK